MRCPRAAIRRAVAAAMRRAGRRADLSIVLVDDAEMAALNERYLNHAGPTDVLAFPYEADEDRVCGEIVLNAQRAAAEAAGRRHSAEGELMLYLVHGLLHLLGCDDARPAQRREMRRREAELLAEVGYDVDF
ncbi:MAG: rRNA maturation RNase YbeY [Candidatus Brocadiaceae bacterium]|nr:rRNA maturation RNase YbeY [Candidatus Brocadiaceae bacterium]